LKFHVSKKTKTSALRTSSFLLCYDVCKSIFAAPLPFKVHLSGELVLYLH
jgi:hypothetical protein